MCGIVGVCVSGRSDSAADSIASRMLATIAHRGPDGRGIQNIYDGRLAFGHARLAIIDVSPAGAQPMRLHGTDLWITYNGEIYNFRPLRRELEALGRTFRTQSDTEVLLAGYAEWGEGLLDRIEGIFAFGLWDGTKRRLWLVRDHFGIKPLYYTCDAGQFSFASEPRALLAAASNAPRPDPNAVRDFLSFGYIPGTRSAYEGVAKLPAGHSLIWEEERVRIFRYWKPTGSDSESVRDERTAVEETMMLLDRATESQLESDVPVGLIVSGGIDSSAVASSVARRHQVMDGFVIGFDDPAFDEREYASLLARSCGIRLHERVVSAHASDALIAEMAAAYDEPFADSSTIPSLALFRLVRDYGLKVVQGGDGGDELFGGYRRYDRLIEVEGLSQARWPWKVAGAQDFKQALRIAVHPGRSRRPAWRSYYEKVRLFSFAEQRQLLSPKWQPQAEDELSWLFTSTWDSSVNTLKAARQFDIETYLAEDILMKLDRASMRYGVEARVPLLDRRLVELALRLEPSLLRRDGQRKYVLKRGLEGRVPSPLLSNRKRGFSLPLEMTVGDRLRSWIAKFSQSAIVRDGVVSAPLSSATLGNLDQVWALFALDLWWTRWVIGSVDTTSQ